MAGRLFVIAASVGIVIAVLVRFPGVDSVPVDAATTGGAVAGRRPGLRPGRYHAHRHEHVEDVHGNDRVREFLSGAWRLGERGGESLPGMTEAEILLVREKALRENATATLFQGLEDLRLPADDTTLPLCEPLRGGGISGEWRWFIDENAALFPSASATCPFSPLRGLWDSSVPCSTVQGRDGSPQPVPPAQRGPSDKASLPLRAVFRPYNCRFPAFDVENWFSRVLSGRTVLVLGDEISKRIFMSMVCRVHATLRSSWLSVPSIDEEFDVHWLDDSSTLFSNACVRYRRKQGQQPDNPPGQLCYMDSHHDEIHSERWLAARDRVQRLRPRDVLIANGGRTLVPPNARIQSESVLHVVALAANTRAFALYRESLPRDALACGASASYQQAPFNHITSSAIERKAVSQSRSPQLGRHYRLPLQTHDEGLGTGAGGFRHFLPTNRYAVSMLQLLQQAEQPALRGGRTDSPQRAATTAVHAVLPLIQDMLFTVLADALPQWDALQDEQEKEEDAEVMEPEQL